MSRRPRRSDESAPVVYSDFYERVIASMKFSFAHNNINENQSIGLYFIADPYGYLVEIMPIREANE